MLTWLDHCCRHAVRTVDVKHHSGDPRQALAYHVGQEILAGKKGGTPDDILNQVQIAFFAPFIADLIPQSSLFLNGKKPVRPLALLLTRETANLLSAASPINIPDTLWLTELGERAIYIDVPHGAILMDGGGGANDVVELRAIFAAPYLPLNLGKTLFLAQMTNRASEQGRGRLCGVLMPDGGVSQFSGDSSRPTVNSTIRPPLAHSMLERERVALGRAGAFLRLVLAYHFFGPKQAQEAIAATPSGRLRAGKPKKDESLFAMTRLHASYAVNRPKHTIPSSWSLSTQQEVTGHFKLQAHGPNRSLRRLIWVDFYVRGPEDVPQRPQGYRV